MSLNRKSLKEKIVQLYESLFTKEPMELLSSKPDYWEEFFLLKPNCEVLKSLVKDFLKKENKIASKRHQTINVLFSQCIAAVKDENQIRIANALLTLNIISRIILHKQLKNSQNIDRIDVLIGNLDLDVKMELLLLRLCELLFMECPIGLKSLILDFLLILVTSENDLQENQIMVYLMSDHLFDAFISLMSNSGHRQQLGFKSVLLLTLFVNFKKDQINNPFIVKLSIIHKEVALNGFANVICSTLNDFNREFGCKHEEPTSGGIFSSITSLVGNMFVADDDGSLKPPKPKNVKPRNSILLAFYQAIHLNRNFITLLTNCTADPIEENKEENCVLKEKSSSLSRVDTPSNLLVTFLEFCSIVMQNTKDPYSMKTCRLCFIILTCVTEDTCANAITHDSNISFHVQIHKMPMRHKKVIETNYLPSRPLCHSILDLMIEFIFSNLRKSLPVDHHTLALGIIHRTICYQKRWKIRFNYNWKELWSALITLLKFLINHESELIKSCKLEIFNLIYSSLNIFNFFITFGDTFLPSATMYDQLYYELIRMAIVFENLNSMATRYFSNISSPYKSISGKIISSLDNIKAIINHFGPKIDSWRSNNEIESLTEENVLEIVKDNYDSLTLKLQEGLDSYEYYSSSNPEEEDFFSDMTRNVITEFRDSLKSNKNQSTSNESECKSSDHMLLINEILASQRMNPE